MAEVATDGTVETSTKSLPFTAVKSIVPIRLIQDVKNTKESILINENETDIPGIIQGYLLKYQPQSIFCILLLYQGKLYHVRIIRYSKTLF